VNNYLSGEFFWDGQDLQLLDANMGLSPIQDDKQKNKTIQLLNKFKLKNSRMMNSASGLVPDSLLQKY
jgi:hypothetical protein